MWCISVDYCVATCNSSLSLSFSHSLSLPIQLKCHQYWPNYGSTTYGSIQVTLKGVENLAEYSIRTFQITPVSPTLALFEQLKVHVHVCIHVCMCVMV